MYFHQSCCQGCCSTTTWLLQQTQTSLTVQSCFTTVFGDAFNGKFYVYDMQVTTVQHRG
jgi:hypothetical protein